MIQTALTEAWMRISRQRSGVGELVLPTAPDLALIATAYDDATEQSLYVQPLEALTQSGSLDETPTVYVRPRLPDGQFGRWDLKTQ
jgi:hypothetical protein